MEQKKWLTPKRVFIGLFSLSALGIGFYALTRRSNKPGEDTSRLLEEQPETEIQPGTTPAPLPGSGGSSSTGTKKPVSDFPLRKGSRGDKVKLLQQTLLAKYPGIIKSGATGYFGDETQAALLNKGLPAEITEDQFKALTAVDPQTIASNLFAAAQKKDFKAAMASLQQIKNPSEYVTVNEKFKAKRLGGVSTTIVTGLLSTFSQAEQKDQLAIAFTTMGLEKKDGKWTIPTGVSGLRKAIVTVRPTKVWRDARHLVQVGGNTILGYEVSSAGGITVFDTVDGFRLNVVTSHVKYA
ncbi:MAG: hypothetical protein AB1458_12030 [Bacteroidota bacterium]